MEDLFLSYLRNIEVKLLLMKHLLRNIEVTIDEALIFTTPFITIATHRYLYKITSENTFLKPQNYKVLFKHILNTSRR